MADPVAPGRAIQALGVGHTVWGLVAYRRPVREIARAGYLDSVGDGLFRRQHSADARAAAFWFLFVGPMTVALGELIERARAAGDRDAVRLAGATVVALAAAGALAMPRSGFPAGIAAGLYVRRSARR